MLPINVAAQKMKFSIKIFNEKKEILNGKLQFLRSAP